FVQTGDIIIFTGQELEEIYLKWKLDDYDHDILKRILNADKDTGCEIDQRFFAFVAKNQGKTEVDIELKIKGEEILEYEFKIFVDLQPALTAVKPRNHCY